MVGLEVEADKCESRHVPGELFICVGVVLR
jgi:hypothetical protein